MRGQWRLMVAMFAWWLGMVSSASAQFIDNYITATLPATCGVGQLAYQTNATAGLYVCPTPNTWTLLAAQGGGSSGVPAGLIALITSGACPTGWTESSALNGKMLRGTVAANGDVGTTGGADTITPTVASLTAAAPSFLGAAWTPPAIAWPAGVPTFLGASLAAMTFAIPTGSGSFKGTSAGGFSTVGGAAPGSAGATTSKSPGTPAGTVAWPAGVPTIGAYTPSGTNGTSAVTGTLNNFDNRPAYTNVIFCQKN